MDNIDAYSDADHAGDKVTRRSTSGSVIMFAGGAVLWKSKFQRCIALSSMEAEYVVASETANGPIAERHVSDQQRENADAIH